MDSLFRDKLSVTARSGNQITRGGLAVGSLCFINDLLSENSHLSECPRNQSCAAGRATGTSRKHTLCILGQVRNRKTMKCFILDGSSPNLKVLY